MGGDKKKKQKSEKVPVHSQSGTGQQGSGSGQSGSGQASSLPSTDQASSQRQFQVKQSGRDHTPKRRRCSSDITDISECDPEIILDSLIGNLGSDDNLLERFVTHLLRVPNIQQKIVSHVSDMLSNKTTCDQLGQLQSSSSQSLQQSVQELTSVVSELKEELESSRDKYDDLEQYSRRNNIRISGIPETDSQATESLVCNALNQYLESPILPTDIDRCHRIFRPSAAVNPRSAPKDIIVKFVSYKTKASLLSKVPMEKLRADNLTKPPDGRIYVSDDLTRTRSKIFFKTRKLKKMKQIKDTYSRDGRIIIKTKTDRVLHVTTEKELVSVCTKFGIRQSGDQPASPMATGNVPVVPSQLNPYASLFQPEEPQSSQSLLQGGATAM